MCGIFFSATRSETNDPHQDNALEKTSTVKEECQHRLSQTLLDRLSCRGPDSNHTISRKGPSLISTSLENESTTSATTLNPEQIKHLDLTFHSTVLSLRGSSLTPQPIKDLSFGNILCWNGEAWRIGDKRLEYGESDTDVIFELLQNASRQSRVDDDQHKVIQAIMTIQGPFAFVYYDSETGRVYFGRDCIGRRSLLYKTEGSSFILSSVGDGSAGWEEVPADGIYVLDLCRVIDKVDAQQTGVEITHDTELDIDQSSSNKRLLETPGVHIKHYSYESFDKYAAFNHTPPAAHQRRLMIHSSAISELETLLLSALTIRIRTIPGLQHETIPTSSTSPPAQIAILFSGGLDCTTLARLLHTILPPSHSIDLLNVAFHNPHIHKSTTPSPAIYASCPDRITALQSHAELQRVCPERLWRLVEINVPFDEAMRERQLVADLMSPKCTEMDLSIAMALFFASRGKGIVRTTKTASSFNISSANNASNTKESVISEYTYTTPARILLSGLGADELFAGYARHATAFTRAGYAGLTAELALDVQRLGSRNLGRDDRVVSHWGREVRYPFLDEKVMVWAVGKGVGELCGFGLGGEDVDGFESEKTVLSNSTATHTDDTSSTIEDGKLVLRLLADKLGMHQVAREKKRAIQFGARTAKMHGKTSGTAAMMTTVSGHGSH